MNVVSRCPAPPFPFPKRGHPREGRRALASDPEVIETMTQNGVEPRNDGDARRAIYALLAGAQDDELADFLCHVQRR
jgi:hypothetical protein